MNLIKICNRNRWNLAFFEKLRLQDVLSGDFSSVRWMRYADKSRWFADPFILSYDDGSIKVLVEELSYSINRGRIAMLTVDRKTMQLRDMKIILDLPTHLSFPMILRRGEEVIVIPENSASGKSTAYRLDEKRARLEPVSVVIDEPLADAAVCKIGDRDLMLATTLPVQNGNVLRVYDFDMENLKAEFSYEMAFESPKARNAGCVFEDGGKLYRPAQDCDGVYGKGVILQEIEDDRGKLELRDSGSIYPFTFRYHFGVHTLNVCREMCVIDARGLLHPYIGRIVRPIVDIVKPKISRFL